MKKIFILSFFCVLAIFFSDCKKDADVYGPVINITMPYENQQFTLNDFIRVQGEICDDRKLEYVNVTVTDENFVTVINGGTFYPQNNCYTLDASIQITDNLLQTSDYYLLVKAYDGANETKKFIKISYTQGPKKLKYIIVVTKNGNNIGIHKLDSNNNVTLVLQINTDYSHSVVSSDLQQFYIAGRYIGDVSVYGTDDWQMKWNIPVVYNPPFPYFETIDIHNRQLYVSFYEGKFEIFNKIGNRIVSRTLDNGFYPKLFMPLGTKFLATYETDPMNMLKYLVIYNVPSYNVYKKILVNFEIKKIFPLNNDQCLLFCNNMNQGIIKKFEISTETFWNLEYTDKIEDVIKIYTNSFLLREPYAIYTYTYEGFGVNPWASAPNSKCFAYDVLNNVCYYSENYFSLTRKTFFSGTPTSITFTDTIVNILPLYNRD